MIYIYKLLVYLKNKINETFSQYFSIILLKINKVEFAKNIQFNGVPINSIQGKFVIGENFKANSSIESNPIGRAFKCIFIVRHGAKLQIGNNVGLSGTAIVCHKRIILGNNIKIGGNVCIYDTDFHTLNAYRRMNPKLDRESAVCKEVVIEDNVFIGAHSTILKGVTIGENSLIGACSVVSKNIPPNEVWAGNPIEFIKKINNLEEISE